MENPLMFFLFYLEEGIAMAFLGPALIGVRPGARKTVTAGVLLAIIIYLTRNVFPFLRALPYAHTALILIASIVILKFVNVIRWDIACTASMLSILCVFISELVLLPFVFSKFALTQQQVSSSLWLHILTGYTGDLLLFTVAIVVAVTGFSIINFSKNPM